MLLLFFLEFISLLCFVAQARMRPKHRGVFPQDSAAEVSDRYTEAGEKEHLG